MSVKFFVRASLSWIAIAHLLTAAVWSYPGNRHRYDCYDKKRNTFKFGSPTNETSKRILCVANPDLKRSRSSTRSRSRKVQSTQRDYRYINTDRVRYRSDNSGLRFGLGILTGAIISDFFFRPFWWYGGFYPGDFVGIGDTIIGDIGDIYIIDGTDIGDVDIGDVDLGDINIDDLNEGDDFYSGEYDFNSNDLNDGDAFDLDVNDFSNSNDFVNDDSFYDSWDSIDVDMGDFW